MSLNSSPRLEACTGAQPRGDRHQPPARAEPAWPLSFLQCETRLPGANAAPRIAAPDSEVISLPLIYDNLVFLQRYGAPAGRSIPKEPVFRERRGGCPLATLARVERKMAQPGRRVPLRGDQARKGAVERPTINLWGRMIGVDARGAVPALIKIDTAVSPSSLVGCNTVVRRGQTTLEIVPPSNPHTDSFSGTATPFSCA